MIQQLTCTLMLLVGALPALAQKANSNRDNLTPELRLQVQQLEREYGVELVLDDPGFPIRTQYGPIAGTAASLSRIQKHLPVFIEEWRHYAPATIRRTRLKRVILGDDLTHDGMKIGGFCDAKNQAILYDFGSDRVWPDEGWQSFFLRVTVHHELFHVFDNCLSQDIYSDKNWEALNPSGFRYWQPLLDIIPPVTNRYPGFISTLSQQAIPEDKAEIFSHMMLNLHEMECRGKDDMILGKKMEHLKLVLKEFSPEMNDQFWNKIRNLNRPRLTLPGIEDPWATAHPTLPPLPKVEEPKEAITTDAACFPRSHRIYLFRRCKQ